MFQALNNATPLPPCIRTSTCHRLHNIVEDDSLWLEFDYAARPMDAQQLKQRLGRLLPKTRAFRVCGRAKSYPAPSFNKPVVTKAMFKAVESSCPNLRELVLQWTFVESSVRKPAATHIEAVFLTQHLFVFHHHHHRRA